MIISGWHHCAGTTGGMALIVATFFQFVATGSSRPEDTKALKSATAQENLDSSVT